MPDQKILDDINTRVDSQKLENYFPFEKERELGEIVKKLRAEDDKETEKYVQMEWMLLNNAFGYGITDKWKYVLEQIELGEKPDFWTYTKETVEYFKKRKQGKIPPIGRARINYYLWTATKDFGYAKDAINDFEIAMEEHSATNEVGYAQTGLFCGKIALKMMVAFGQTERIETLFLPKLMVLINNVSVPHLQREFVNLGFICIQTIRKKDESRGTGEAQQLMDISKKTILEFVRVAEYHQAIMWLDQLEHFAKEMKDSNLSCDLQQQHLLIMIADAEQGSSQLIKCSFYQAALTYFQTMTVKDKAIEQKLKQYHNLIHHLLYSYLLHQHYML